MSEQLNAVVDLSHHNGDVDFVKLREAGILGVIHKATQWVSGVDPTLEDHRTKARDA